MDSYPLINSVRIAAISTGIVFFLGIWAANSIARLPPAVKSVLDVVLTLPLALPQRWWAGCCLCSWGRTAPSAGGRGRRWA